MTLMMATALMWCGCGGSGDEPGGEPTPQPTEKAIAFSGDLTEESVTRAGETPLQNYHQTFKVWAFKNDAGSSVNIVMNKYTVNWINNSANTTASNSSNWEYVNQQELGDMVQSIKYWDFTASAYRFFGIAGSTETNRPTVEYKPNADNPTSIEVTYAANAESATTPYYSHLWYSNNVADYGKPVQLEFIMPLSRVRFKFIFEDPSKAQETELTGMSFKPSDGNTIKIKGDVTVTYKLTGLYEKEKFSLGSELEGIVEFTKDYYTEADIKKKTINEGEEDEKEVVISPYYNAPESSYNKEYKVLPTPQGQSSYTMTVDVDGEPKTSIVPAQYMTWQPGYLYTYIFKVHKDGSVAIDNVQSAFTEWIDHEKDNHVIHNW